MNNIQKIKVSKFQFDIVLFIISFFIIIFTIPYWVNFIDDKYGIITAIMKKIDKMYPKSKVLDRKWLFFYLNLLLTGLGMVIYYSSGFSQWIGASISNLPFIKNMYYEDPKTNTLKNYVFFFFSGIALLFLALITFSAIEGEEVPLSYVFPCIILFLIITVVINIGFVEPEILPNHNGIVNRSTEYYWLKVADEQIAYVQDRSNKRKWVYNDSQSIIDLTFRSAYLFKTNSDIFWHTIENETLVKDIDGHLSYRCQVGFDSHGIMPTVLSTEQVKFFDEKLRNKEGIKKVIFLSFNKEEVVTDIKSKLSFKAQSINNPELANNDRDKEEIYEEIKRLTFADVQKEIGKQILDKITETSGLKNLIKVYFTISDQKFYRNEIIDVINEARKARQKEREEIEILDSERKYQLMLQARTAYFAERKQVLDALMTASTNIAFGSSMVIEIRQFIKELERQNPDNYVTLNEVKEAQNVLHRAQSILQEAKINEIAQSKGTSKEDFMAACEEIAWVIKTNVRSGATNEKIMNEISKSTDFFQKSNLNVYDFFDKLKSKLFHEKQEREHEFYRSLVEDTLKEL